MYTHNYFHIKLIKYAKKINLKQINVSINILTLNVFILH